MESIELLKSLSLRLRKLEDQSALTTLLNRYCWQVDLKNWDKFGETYVEDAKMDFEAFGQIRGRENIVKGTIEAEDRFEGMQHSMTNREFSIDYTPSESLDGSVGDKSTATAYLIFAITEDTRKNAQEHFKMGGPYQFEFERVHDPSKDPGEGWDARGWRITSMKLRLVWAENDEVDRFGVFTKRKAPTLH